MENGHASEPDAGLVERLRARDPAAFDEIVSRYRQQIFRFVLRSVRDWQTAEDITQDTFLKLYRHTPNLKNAERFVPWLYRAARTTVIDFHRRASRERRIFAEGGPLSGMPLHEDPVPSLEHKERGEHLRRAIADLPERFRTPFVMREVEGLRYQEIARTLRIPEKTVSSRISRARRMLAARLANRYGSPPTRKDGE